jgi:predicted PurR-regulated permease PerM
MPLAALVLKPKSRRLPLLRDPWLRALSVLLVIIAALCLAYLVWLLAGRFADILLVLALAWVVSFAIEPGAHFLHARTRMRRGVAVGLVYLALLVVLSLSTLLLIPVVVMQLSQLGTNLPQYVASAQGWVDALQSWLADRGITVEVASLLDPQRMAEIVDGALSLATGTATALFGLVLVLMFSFYMTLDGPRLTASALRAIPDGRRDDAAYLVYSVQRAFAGFIRGQLIQAVVYGIGLAAIMTVADLSYVAVASVFAFAVMMIPFAGPILATIPPVAIVLLVHPERAWWVFLALLVLAQAVVNVLAPKVLSTSIGMHPMLVLVALLVGAKLAGLWGAIFALPVAGVIVAMVFFYRMTIAERKLDKEERAEEAIRLSDAELVTKG